MTALTRMVGRSAERALLSAAMASAATGQPAAVVLHGEPGVGKTALVTEASRRWDDAAHHVLWARCLRFGTEGSAFLAIAQSLSRWLTGPVAAETRASAFEDADDLAALIPELGASAGGVPGGRLMTLLTTVIHRIATDAPTVLVADDIQWADTSSLDLLAYLIAGFGPGEKLAILGTYRDTELEPGHGLHGWVADMRRMPRVTIERLGGLDRLETAMLVRRLAPVGDQASDPEAVFERSRGNPYLTELAVNASGEDGGTLSEALLAGWHRMSPTARELTAVLAVGGRPVPLPVLATVLDWDAGPRTREAVSESLSAGMVVADGGTLWFRHPLLAEVVASTVDALAAARIHEAYVNALNSGTGIPDLAREALLAVHHEAAGRTTAAFVASLRAADAAALVYATSEESQHLERACRLWDGVAPAVRDATGDRAELFERTSLAALKAGRLDVHKALARQALDAVDGAQEPLRMCRLLLTVGLERDVHTDPWATRLANAQHAAALTEPYGPTDELAFAMAHVAWCKLWSGMADAEDDARTAVSLAERVGSPTTVGFAHLVHSQFFWTTDSGLAEAETAWEELRTHGSVLDWGMRSMMYMNCLEGTGATDRLVTEGIRILTETTRLGAPSVGAFSAVRSVWELIRLGRHDEARRVLRSVHAHQQPTATTLEARASAVVLAVRTGEMAEAQEHARRIEELWTSRSTVGTYVGDALIELAWAGGEWASVLDLVRVEIARVWHVDPERAEDWLVWAARSAADLGESGAKNVGARQRAIELLAQIDQLRPEELRGTYTISPEQTHRFLCAVMVDAERSRLSLSEDQEERWAEAGGAARRAGYPWEEAWSAYQRGRVLLRQRGRRSEAAYALRDAHSLADSIGAGPLVERVAALAAQARISLAVAPAVGATNGAPTVVLGVAVTSREAEVLRHLVAGRTYGEIAKDLFISEKTVSVHVSNLLHKTGTRSRVELAELVARQAAT